MPSPLDEPLPEEKLPTSPVPPAGAPSETPIPPAPPGPPADTIQPPTPQAGPPPAPPTPPPAPPRPSYAPAPPPGVPSEPEIAQEGGSPFLKWFLIILIILILIGGGVFIYLRFFQAQETTPGTPTLPSSTEEEKSTGISPLNGTAEEETTPSETTTLDTPAKRDTKRKTDLKELKAALEKYFTDNNSYPKADVVLQTNEKGNILETTLIPKYLSKLPVDPQDPLFYYSYKSDGTTFELSSILEVTTDPDGTTIGLKTLYILKND